MELGKSIQELRKKLNITQEELGKAVGVSTQAVSRWENGGAPDMLLLPAIADKLGVSIDALFGRGGVRHEDPEETVRALMLQVPKGKRLAAAEEYVWTMIKVIATDLSDLEYDIISSFDEINRSEGEGYRMYHCVVGADDTGLIKASVARDFKYTLLMPTPEKGFASILRRVEDYLLFFELLLRPHWLEMLVFLYTRRRVSFTPSLAAQELGLRQEEAEEILREMERFAFVYSNEYDTENGLVHTYYMREGLALIPFLYFAGELMKESDGGGIGLNENRDPILRARPGEGNPHAEWNVGRACAEGNEWEPNWGIRRYDHSREEEA